MIRLLSARMPSVCPVTSRWPARSPELRTVDNIGVFRCPAAGVCTWFVDAIGQTGLSTRGSGWRQFNRGLFLRTKERMSPIVGLDGIPSDAN